MRRSNGALILACYVAFVATVVATAVRTSATSVAIYLLPAVVLLSVSAVVLMWSQPNGQAQGFQHQLGPKSGTGIGVSQNG